jgi:acetyl/propionyl-CoA carboxylase alpha subunit
LNLDRIELIIRMLQQQSHVGEISVEAEGWRLRAVRSRFQPPLPPDLMADFQAPPEPEPIRVQAGMVGIFRALDSPLLPGDHVAEGSVIGNIDAMRIQNPVTAQAGGYITEIRVSDGDPVEYGQDLIVLSPELPEEAPR